MKKNVENHQVNRLQFGQLVVLTVVFSLLILPVRLNAQGAKVNFSGSWAFNAAKSILGEGRGNRAASQIIVVQDGSNLTADRVRTNQNGESTTTTEKYTLDGKESLNTSERGSSKAIVTWSADRKTLNFAITRSFERDGQTTERKSTEVWTLTDAKTLTVQSTSTTQDGERKATMVYDKK